MQITFTLPTDKAVHTYCSSCQTENPGHSRESGRDQYICRVCGHVSTQAIIIDPKVEYWLSPNRTYWHRTAGIRVIDNGGRWLFFDRSRHPFGITVPAGHVDSSDGNTEDPKIAAQRELLEETGISTQLDDIKLVEAFGINGDECRRGCDNHFWHLYAVRVKSGTSVTIQASEGSKPIWLAPADALSCWPTAAVKYILANYANKVANVLQ